MSLGPWQIVGLQLVGVVAAARILDAGGAAFRLRASLLRGHRREAARAPVGHALWVIYWLALVGAILVLLRNPAMPPFPVVMGALAALTVATAVRLWALIGDVGVVAPRRFLPGRAMSSSRRIAAMALEIAALPLVAGAWELSLAGTAASAFLLARGYVLRYPRHAHSHEIGCLGRRHPSGV